MSDPESGAGSRIRGALVRPADASYGSATRRWTAVAFVGLLGGLVGAMGSYVFRLEPIAPAWASADVTGAAIVLSGVLVKLLCQNLRASVAAVLVAWVTGAAASVAFAAAPYYLLAIPTAGGWALLPTVRDAVTFAVVWQFPLQIGGYLLAIVYEGLRA